MPITTYIALGSNMGDKMATCRRALDLLSRAGRVTRVSSFYRTEPVGYPNQEDFINAVAELETSLSPLALLAACHVIEDDLGRSRLLQWGPRTIDLDILLYGDQVVNNSELTIPHPLMARRRFVLVPLCEIAPQATHPVICKTVADLLKELTDAHRVVRCSS
jgi:2-amino-4-hydroxy-6-hydroxymethyldihydropteridine diphosphokinase/dihydroneopterin aldolase/2-amino-4-hydroxy-6-hydroxymethyldihydropteridine diphosphokinase